MPIVSATSSLINEHAAVSLARYAQLIGYKETAFFGIMHDGDPEYGCRTIWTKMQRDTVAHALWEAQIELEQIIGYPLSPQYFVEEVVDYKPMAFTKYGKVISIGVRAKTLISANVALNHASDPATVGPLATTVTDVNEIRVFYPGTDIELVPSAITLSGGNVVIEIPRARLVEASSQENPEEGWDYTDTGATGAFLQVVDVSRVYTDTSQLGTLEIKGCSCTCEEHAYDLTCVTILDSDLGVVSPRYTGTSCSSIRASKAWVSLNYVAGLQTLTPQVEDTIIRLAHAKMPDAPCGCDSVKGLWTRDKNIPEIATRERINCPFGLSDGAWTAWRFAQALRMFRGSVI